MIENTTSCINPALKLLWTPYQLPGKVLTGLNALIRLRRVCDCGCGYPDIDCEQPDSGVLSYSMELMAGTVKSMTNYNEIVNPSDGGGKIE